MKRQRVLEIHGVDFEEVSKLFDSDNFVEIQRIPNSLQK